MYIFIYIYTYYIYYIYIYICIILYIYVYCADIYITIKIYEVDPLAILFFSILHIRGLKCNSYYSGVDP